MTEILFMLAAAVFFGVCGLYAIMFSIVSAAVLFIGSSMHVDYVFLKKRQQIRSQGGRVAEEDIAAFGEQPRLFQFWKTI